MKCAHGSILYSMSGLATTVQLKQRYVINEGAPDGRLCLSVSGTFNTVVVLQFQVSDGTASGVYIYKCRH